VAGTHATVLDRESHREVRDCEQRRLPVLISLQGRVVGEQRRRLSLFLENAARGQRSGDREGDVPDALRRFATRTSDVLRSGLREALDVDGQ